MTPSVFAIVMHLGKIIHAVKDIEKSVSDILQGKASIQDAEIVGADIADLLESGLFSIPGISSEQLGEAINEIRKGFSG